MDLKLAPLRLNEGLGLLEIWNEKTIRDRAEKLSEQAVKLWQYPNLSPEVLESYRLKINGSTGYTINDHKNLSPGTPMKPLFEKLRKEILGLDPCVSEDILKLYVAYKAETNFVDIVPQKNKLRLSLNMHFEELQDPMNKAKDVTNLGHWANGDIEIDIEKKEELPYTMGLIRQAFEKQMDNGG